MLHKKYRINVSDLHGVGLFSDEYIKRGEVVYTASPMLDINITQEQFDTLDIREKQEIKYWGHWNEIEEKWHVDFDASRYINHSFRSNLTQGEECERLVLVATRDIRIGEELTQNYLEFENLEDLKARGIPTGK